MKNINREKLISLTMAVLLAASSASCSSKDKISKVISKDDPWYECSSFDASAAFDPSEYENTYFETVGSTKDSIYLKADAHKYIDYSKEMTEEEYLEYYEQYVLEFSFDGELLNKTLYHPEIVNGCYRGLLKAFISEGKLNVLEEEYNMTTGAARYFMNGEELSLPKEYFDEYDFVNIEDIYKVSGYTVLKLARAWDDEFIIILRSDGTYDYFAIDELVNNGSIMFTGNFIPVDDVKFILPVYLSSYEEVYVSFDLETMKTEELQSLYGTTNFMLEYVSGKTVVKDYKGLNFIDRNTGRLDPICEYCDIDMAMLNIVESQTLYISDDASEIILGYESYDRSDAMTSRAGFTIAHLTRSASNPHAGKNLIILSNDSESLLYEEYDYMAIHLFNQSSSSCFIKYVIPLDETGRYKKVDADIIRSTDSYAEPADKEKYVDLMPYLGLNDGSYKQKYFANAIDASKNGNALYRVPLNISATGILTASSNVPEGQHGFTFDEYIKFVDEVCNGTDPMTCSPDMSLNKSEYFTRLFMYMSDLFIKDGRVDLSGEEFRELLRFVDEHGKDDPEDYDNIYGPHNQAVMEVIAEIDEHNARLEGKYGAVYDNLYSFNSYIDCYRMYGEGLGIYGLPSVDGRGPMTMSTEFVFVSNTTAYPDACAEYVKILLSDEVQGMMYGNSINREVLRTKAEDQLNRYNDEESIQLRYGRPVTDADLIPSEAVDKYIEILSSSYGGISIGSSIEEILIEESSAYFNGSRAIDDVIPVMQNRIQTVINENK